MTASDIKQAERKRIHDQATLNVVKSRLHHPRRVFNPHKPDNTPSIPKVVYTIEGRISIEEAKRQGITTDEYGYCASQPFTYGYCRYAYFTPELHDPETWYRRVPVKCPLCGRKLTARQCYNEDGDRFFSLPRHKPKGYRIPPKRKTAHKRLKHYSRTTPK